MQRKDFSSIFCVGPKNSATVGWKKPLFECPKVLRKFRQINFELSTKNLEKPRKGLAYVEVKVESKKWCKFPS